MHTTGYFLDWKMHLECMTLGFKVIQQAGLRSSVLLGPCQIPSRSRVASPMQDSMLGPDLFTLYTNRIPDLIRQKLPIMHAMYADDTQTLTTLKKTEYDAVITRTEQCLTTGKKTFASYGLMMNASKM